MEFIRKEPIIFLVAGKARSGKSTVGNIIFREYESRGNRVIVTQITKYLKGYIEDITGSKIDESLKFIDALNKSRKKVWIRQVVVPGLMDNREYLKKLSSMVHKIKNVEKIEFLPYHKLGSEKYKKLGITDPYKDMKEMDKEECKKLYDEFMKIYDKKLAKNL